MRTTPKQYAISLYEATKEVPKEEAAQFVENFVKLLRANNDLSLGKKIITEYENYYRKQKGISKLRITSSEKLSSEAINGIVRHFSKQVELEEKVDESLIGGITLQIDDDILIDGSVKKKLESVRKAI